MITQSESKMHIQLAFKRMEEDYMHAFWFDEDNQSLSVILDRMERFIWAMGFATEGKILKLVEEDPVRVDNIVVPAGEDNILPFKKD